MGRPIGLRVEWDGESAQKLRERCGDASRAGFDCVELAVPKDDTNRATSLDEKTDDPAAAEAGVGIRVAALSTRCTLQTVPQASAEIGAMLRWARRLGAEGLNLHLAPLVDGEDKTRFPCHSDVLSAVGELLRGLRVEAERIGVMLSLEAVADQFYLSPVELRELIDGLSAWPFGVCVDLARVARFGPPEDWLLTLRQRVRCVRVYDANLSRLPEEQADARAVDTGRVVAALDEIQYEGPIICAGAGDPGDIRARLMERFRHVDAHG